MISLLVKAATSKYYAIELEGWCGLYDGEDYDKTL